LVAPQGFTSIANKGDRCVFHILPHVLPQTRNEDSNSDLRGRFVATLKLHWVTLERHLDQSIMLTKVVWSAAYESETSV
jgi:hypothetical protein